MSKNKNRVKPGKAVPRKLSEDERRANHAKTRARKARKHGKKYTSKGKDPKKCRNTELARPLEEMRLFHPQSKLGAMFPEGGVPDVNVRNVPVRNKKGGFVFRKGKNGQVKTDKKGNKIKVTERKYTSTGSFHGPSLDLGGYGEEQQYAVLQLLAGITSDYIWVTPPSADWHTPKAKVDKLPHLRKTLTGKCWYRPSVQSSTKGAWHVESEDGFVRLDESNYEDYVRGESYVLCSLRKKKHEQELAKRREEIEKRQEAEEARRKARYAKRRKLSRTQRNTVAKSSEKMVTRPPVHWK